MYKIGVTGGAGFVGTNLVRSLLSENYEVIILDDFSTGLRSNLRYLDCEVREGSLLDREFVNHSLKNCEYIFHLGARGSVPRSIKEPRATMEVNVFGTQNVLETAKETGATVAFSSSSSVYGANTKLPKSEDMWCAPMTPYAASKLSGEALVTSYSVTYGFSAITYRFFNIFGPWQRPNHDYAAVIPKWIWSSLHKEPIEVYGEGTQTRDFTYIETVIDVLMQGFKERINHPNPINLAYGNSITLNQCVEEIKKRIPNLEVKYLPERHGDVRNSQNNPALVKEIFPKIKPIDFSFGVDRVFDWISENRNNYLEVTNVPSDT